MKRTKLVLIALFLAFALTFSPALALNIDAQNTTSCDSLGNCKTEIDLTKFLSAGAITTLKSVNLTTYLPSLDVKLKTINYSYNASKLIVAGKVLQNTYWTFDLKNGYVIDPWWNYTSYNLTNWSITLDSQTNVEDATGFWTGIKFHTYKAGKLIEVQKYPGTNYSNVGLQNSTHFFLSNATFSGNVAVFSYDLVNNTDYYLIGWDSGARAKGVVDPAGTYPFTTAAIYVTASAYSASPYTSYTDYTIKVFSIQKVVIQTNSSLNTSVWYDVALFLNGNQSNITIDSATALNATAWTNLTGLNVSLYNNGTLTNYGTTSATNISTLSAGLYNITAYFVNNSNTSINATLTWWANMTYTAPAAVSNISATYNINLNNAPLTCINSTHVARNTSFYVNGVMTPVAEVYYCPNGCDNATNSCKPDRWQVDMLAVGIFAAIIIIFAWIFKKVSHL